MSYPLFRPGRYQAGERCTYEGQAFEKIRTGTVSAAPREGAVWRVVKEITDSEQVSSMVMLTLDELREVTKASPRTLFVTFDPGRFGNWLLGENPTGLPDNTGTRVLSAGGLCFLRQWNKRHLDLGWFDLRAGDAAQALPNALKLDAIIKEFDNVHATLPADEKPVPRGSNPYYYHLAAVPGSGLVKRKDPETEEIVSDDIEACITILDKAWFKLEFAPGVVGLKPGNVLGGQSAFGTVHLLNVQLLGPGALSNGLVNAVGFRHNETREVTPKQPADLHNYTVLWDEDRGNYKPNGWNFWCKGSMVNCRFYGNAGNGATIYGSTDFLTTTNRVPFTASLEIGYQEDLVIRFESPEFVKENIRTGMYFDINGVTRQVSTMAEGSVIGSLGYAYTDETKLGKIEGEAFDARPHLFADHVFLFNNNFDGNLAEGCFFAGNEAQAGLCMLNSARENGAGAVRDGSQLGNTHIAWHATQNGGLHEGRVGPYSTNSKNSSRASWVGCYGEDGQGQSTYESNVLVVGGHPGNGGLSGGFGLVEQEMRNLQSNGPDQRSLIRDGKVLMTSDRLGVAKDLRLIDTPHGVDIGT